MERILIVLKRLGAVPRQLGQIMRVFGSFETSRLSLLGALFWFVMFSGIWLMMTADFVAARLRIPIAIWPTDFDPTTLGDLFSGTLFTLLVVLMTGNFLYGRLIMSRAIVEAQAETWTDLTWQAYAHMQTSAGPYSWRGYRLILQISGIVGLLMILSWLFLPFVE